jgi:hypothetical protein
VRGGQIGGRQVLRLRSGWCLELFRGHDELLAESHDRGGSDKSFQLKPCLPLPRRHTIIRFASTSEWDGLPHPTRQLSSWPILPSSHDPRTHHSRTSIPRPLQLEDRGIFKDKELAFVANLSDSFPYGMRLRMFCGSQGSRFCGFVRATHATLRVHACRRSLETMACMEVILFSAQLRTVRKERTSRRWHGNMSEELRFDSPSTTSCSRREYISTLEPWNTEIR